MKNLGNMQGIGRPHGKNPAKLALQEKADASFACGVRLLESRVPSIDRLGLYLLIFSIELSLKRIIIDHSRFKDIKDTNVGMTFTDFKNKDIFGTNGHNVTLMYDFAIQEKLIETDNLARKLLAQNNEEYTSSDFRYYVGLRDIFGESVGPTNLGILKAFYARLPRF
jgi:hypothetical protein